MFNERCNRSSVNKDAARRHSVLGISGSASPSPANMVYMLSCKPEHLLSIALLAEPVDMDEVLRSLEQMASGPS